MVDLLVGKINIYNFKQEQKLSIRTLIKVLIGLEILKVKKHITEK